MAGADYKVKNGAVVHRPKTKNSFPWILNLDGNLSVCRWRSCGATMIHIFRVPSTAWLELYINKVDAVSHQHALPQRSFLPGLTLMIFFTKPKCVAAMLTPTPQFRVERAKFYM